MDEFKDEDRFAFRRSERTKEAILKHRAIIGRGIVRTSLPTLG
jgi:hypothetical protein